MNQEPNRNTIDKIKKTITGRPTSKAWFSFQNFTYFIGSLLSFCLAFVCINWFISQANIFYVFWPFITTSWSGWLWVLIPEFVIFALLFVASIYFIYKRTDWFGVAWADVISAGLIILMIFANMIINVEAIVTVPPIESMHQAFLSQPYRIWLRDKHIIDLEQKYEYYGALAKLDGNQISIDHGGVVLDFIDYKVEGLRIGQRIWVKFEIQNDNRVVIDQKSW
jgi:hypothetical protein